MKSIALFLLAALTTHAAPRDWTSADGRAINAEYLGRAADGSAIILERTDTKARVTVPVAALSAADQNFVSTLPTNFAPDPDAAAKKATADLIALAKKYPPAPLGDHADLAEVRRRYQPFLAGLTSGDVAANARTLKIKIDRDIPVIKSALDIKVERRETEDPEKYRIRESQVREKQAAAQSSITWLKAVSIHCGKIETLASKQ